MPELPEVETTRRGVLPHVTHRRVKKVIVRQRKLRWTLPRHFEKNLQHAVFTDVTRRAKYLLFETDKGALMLHLGMSGSLRIVSSNTAVQPHDHVDILLDNKKILRSNDPRRFGCMHWITGDRNEHPLLQ